MKKQGMGKRKEKGKIPRGYSPWNGYEASLSNWKTMGAEKRARTGGKEDPGSSY